MKDKPNLSGWSVNRVKVSKMASEETLCFRAEVTLYGDLVGHAFNNGHGGQTYVTLTEAQLKKMNLPAGLTEHVDALVEDHVAVQDLQRTYKRWVKKIMEGFVFALRDDENKAWEAGTDHQESTMPPFRYYSSVEAAQKHTGPGGKDHRDGVQHSFYSARQGLTRLWPDMLAAHYKWKALDDARTDAMLKEYEEKLKARKHDCPPASPQMPDGY